MNVPVRPRSNCDQCAWWQTTDGVTGTCPNRSPDGAFDARQRAASQGRCAHYLGIPEREFGLAN
jgi:hypothetical protein